MKEINFLFGNKSHVCLLSFPKEGQIYVSDVELVFHDEELPLPREIPAPEQSISCVYKDCQAINIHKHKVMQEQSQLFLCYADWRINCILLLKN